MVTKGGLIFEGKCIFENKPPPQSRSCLLLKKGGLIFRRIRYCFVNFFCVAIFHVQWVDKIASAGADQFIFHTEATGKRFNQNLHHS